MRKLLVMLGMCIGLVGAVGCESYTELGDKDTFDIVCSIYPTYDWVKEITAGNENVNVSFLLESGIDLHNYQPTITDIAKIQNADLFIYVGGDSDTWAKDVVNKNMNTVNLVDMLGKMVLDQEEVEGMQSDDSHSHGGWFPHSHDDEHVWLSLLNAEVLVDGITNVLNTIDVTNSELYTKNSEAYIEEIKLLEIEYQKATDVENKETLIFADRFPFLYLLNDYGIEYYAAFSGCSSEMEVSFETIKFLVDKMEELDSNYISAIEGSTNNISKTLNDNLTSEEKEVLIFNSMQSVTKADVESGITYLSLMEENLETLKIALGN